MNLGVIGSLWTHQENGETYTNLTLRGDQVLDLVKLIPSLRNKATVPLRETRGDKIDYDHLPQGATMLSGESYLEQAGAGDHQRFSNRTRTAVAEQTKLADL